MKKVGVYFLGVLTGIILTVVLSLLLNSAGINGSGVSLYDEPGQVIKYNSFEVFQVLPDGSALAWENDAPQFDRELIVLLTPQTGSSYYDDQIVKAPQGTVPREVGVYRYKTAEQFVKTVPVVEFIKKR